MAGAAFTRWRAFRAAFALARRTPRAVTPAAGAFRGQPPRDGATRGRSPPSARTCAVVTGASGPRSGARSAGGNVRNFSRMLADYFYCAGRAARDGAPAARELGRFRALRRGARGRQRDHPFHRAPGSLGDGRHPARAARHPDDRRHAGGAEQRALRVARALPGGASGIRTITVGPGREFAFVEMMRLLRENGCLAMLVDRPYEGTRVARFRSSDAPPNFPARRLCSGSIPARR